MKETWTKFRQASGRAKDALNKYRRMPGRALDRRIRKAAITRVRKDLILHGKSENDLTEQDLEYLLADAEKDVRQKLKTSVGAAVLIALGIGI